MEQHILIKYASRSRPQRFLEGLHNIVDMAANKTDLTVFCCLDEDDVPTKEAVMETLHSDTGKFSQVWFHFGQSNGKIDAINRPLPATIPWDILVNFSDDMRFVVYGYDQLIRDGFRINGPDRFLHYPDSSARMVLPTMSIMDRTYYERDGYIYHPSYKSLWCDNEAMDVAVLRGRYLYMGLQIFDHYHPAYGHVPWDAQYEYQQGFWKQDERNYLYRKANNFFLDATEYSHTDHI